MHGYENVLGVKKARKAAAAELKKVRKLQKKWLQKGSPEKMY